MIARNTTARCITVSSYSPKAKSIRSVISAPTIICLTKGDLPDAIGDIAASGSAVVSFVGNSGNEYIAICNKSWQEKLNVDLTFNREVYTIDRDGIFTEQQPGKSTFVIDEGDMLVVKWR